MDSMEKTICGDGGGEDFFIQEILVCLPVKSLLRFKSVCKSWRELIDTSFFIDLHTATSSSSNKFGTFILQTREPAYKIKMFMFSHGSGGSTGDGEDDDDDDENNEEDDQKKKKKKMVFKVDEDLGFLSFYEDYLLEESLRMVGSCNGIICLHDFGDVTEEERGCSRQHYSNLRDVSLWNPATRQFRILPKSIPIQEREHGGSDFVAFGFDVKTKDYKVLRITTYLSKEEEEQEQEGGCMCRVQVYSLNTNSWRLLEDINYLPVVPTQGFSFGNHAIYLNGSYFFVGRKWVPGKIDEMILSFDFTKEIFTTMQLPDNDSKSSVLSYLGDKMVVFTTPRIDFDGGYDEYYDIWVLNEQHGSVIVNKESWSKLHSFRIKTRRRHPNSEPRCLSNNGEFALISTRTDDGYPWGKLLLFNLVTKEVENDFSIGTQMCGADVYKESLVSIMVGNVLLRWQFPTHGTCYKLNLDAPFIDSHRSFGIGLCLTSDTGGCIGVRSLKGHVRDATEGEALAMLEAIKWAKNLELSPIIIESDSKNSVSFFTEDDDDSNLSTYWSSGALSLLGEAKLLLLNSPEIGITSFQYCSRSCNYVADIAAKLGREGFWLCNDWTANSPGEMVRSLSKDLGSETYIWQEGELGCLSTKFQRGVRFLVRLFFASPMVFNMFGSDVTIFIFFSRS